MRIRATKGSIAQDVNNDIAGYGTGHININSYSNDAIDLSNEKKPESENYFSYASISHTGTTIFKSNKLANIIQSLYTKLSSLRLFLWMKSLIIFSTKSVKFLVCFLCVAILCCCYITSNPWVQDLTKQELLIIADEIEYFHNFRTMKLNGAKMYAHESCKSLPVYAHCFRVENMRHLDDNNVHIYVGISGNRISQEVKANPKKALFIADKFQFPQNPYHEFNNNALPIFEALLNLLKWDYFSDQSNIGKKGYVALLASRQGRRFRGDGIITIGIPSAFGSSIIFDVSRFVGELVSFDAIQITKGIPHLASIPIDCEGNTYQENCDHIVRLVGEIEFDPKLSQAAKVFVNMVIDGVNKIEDRRKVDNVVDKLKKFIIIYRSHTRRFINLDQLKEEVRRPVGWNIIFVDLDLMSFEDIVYLFSHSHIAAGMHGAGLVNCVYLPANSVCIQVLTWRMETDFYVRKEFERISIAVGVKYKEWPCLKFEDTRYPSSYNFFLNPKTIFYYPVMKKYNQRLPDSVLLDRSKPIDFGYWSYELIDADLYFDVQYFQEMIDSTVKEFEESKTKGSS